MNKNITAQTSVIINADVDKVWQTLTSPEKIKAFLMGTHVTTDWKEGSAISFEGKYEGKTYKDKGIIKKAEANKLLQYTYWSSMGGREDKPENYNLVTYKLNKEGNKTQLVLSQDNIRSEKEKEHSLQNWKMVLEKLKEVAEH